MGKQMKESEIIASKIKENGGRVGFFALSLTFAPARKYNQITLTPHHNQAKALLI